MCQEKTSAWDGARLCVTRELQHRGVGFWLGCCHNGCHEASQDTCSRACTEGEGFAPYMSYAVGCVQVDCVRGLFGYSADSEGALFLLHASGPKLDIREHVRQGTACLMSLPRFQPEQNRRVVSWLQSPGIP